MSDADRMAHGILDSTETSGIVRSSEIAGGNFQGGGILQEASFCNQACNSGNTNFSN